MAQFLPRRIKCLRKHFNYSEKSLSQCPFQQDSNKTTETLKHTQGSIGQHRLTRRTRRLNEWKRPRQAEARALGVS
jgi:hypothetical protein